MSVTGKSCAVRSVELQMKTARRGVLYATAAFVAAGSLLVWFFSHAPKKPAHKPVVPAALAGPGR